MGCYYTTHTFLLHSQHVWKPAQMLLYWDVAMFSPHPVFWVFKASSVPPKRLRAAGRGLLLSRQYLLPQIKMKKPPPASFPPPRASCWNKSLSAMLWPPSLDLGRGGALVGIDHLLRTQVPRSVEIYFTPLNKKVVNYLVELTLPLVYLATTRYWQRLIRQITRVDGLFDKSAG